MHQSFLEYVLLDLQKKETDLASCTFVIPSKRSGAFLKKHLSGMLSRNIFSPKILSIQDFVAEISGMAQAPNIDLLLTLYSVYKDSPIDTHDDFLSFLKWGQTLLQDFNEIDGYLVPAQDILNYLSAIKELSHWSLQKDQTDLIKDYLKLWNNLGSIYTAFTAALIAQRRGYKGLMSKLAVENLSSISKTTWANPIIFVGFNALNTAESKIVQHFLEQGNGQVYWDIDSYFLSDPIHDAGLFIRSYQQEWPYYKNKGEIEAQSTFLSPKRIAVTGVPKSISQTKYVGRLLQELKDEAGIDFGSTALVLADEALLAPMLKAVPASINGVNITMGVPLNKTVLYTFFQSYLDMNIMVSERGWFYKNVLEFLSNPYTLTLSSSEELDFAKVLAQDIKENNWIYVGLPMLSNYSGAQHLLNIMFLEKPISPSQWIESCLLLIAPLKTIFQQDKNALELEQLYRFYILFNQLKQHLARADFIKDPKSVKSLFKQLASMETLDFIGEPLTGLQIMGMLESRNLDFETVIITSMNEGILPSGKSNSSFVPFDVKRDYGLPTYKEKDAIYTYHFYRLVQRAKNVYIIYNTEPDVLEGGEKSRLITQLLTDPNIKSYVRHTIALPEVKMVSPSPLEIFKEAMLSDDIKAFANNGFSPTSLTNYVKNPLEFYTRNILKINDVDEVEENIAANTFGTIVHNSLEELYRPLMGQWLTPENLSVAKSQVPTTVKHHFQQSLPGVDIAKGKFLLVYNVIVKYLQNFISLEMEQIQKHEIKILALEEKYEVQLHIPELDFPVKLKGTLDRVDEFDGTVRIVDYKTGRVEPKNVKISDWEDLLTDYDKAKAFQLLCYAYLYHKNLKAGAIIAGLYSFKNLGQGLLFFNQNGKNEYIDSDMLSTFEGYLKRLVLEICNADIPFTEKVD
ncbi:MAG: PD-(D/E)XK nuclease family protein [Allomuricauda sp.]